MTAKAIDALGQIDHECRVRNAMLKISFERHDGTSRIESTHSVILHFPEMDNGFSGRKVQPEVHKKCKDSYSVCRKENEFGGENKTCSNHSDTSRCIRSSNSFLIVITSSFLNSQPPCTLFRYSSRFRITSPRCVLSYCTLYQSVNLNVRRIFNKFLKQFRNLVHGRAFKSH